MPEEPGRSCSCLCGIGVWLQVSVAPGTETCRANYGGYAGFAAGNGVYLNPDYALDLTTGRWAMIQSLCAEIMKVCMQQPVTTPTRQSCVNCKLYCAAYVQPIMLTQDLHGGPTDAAVADDFEYLRIRYS